MRQKRLIQLSDHLVDQGGLNLTPLIDVVFVVLIMFILIAPMLELDRVKLAQAPQREQKENAIVHEDNSLTIHVHEDNSIWINKRKFDGKNLRLLLQAVYAKNSKLIPQLYHDKKALFGTYQVVKNAVEEAGFEELDVILQPNQ